MRVFSSGRQMGGRCFSPCRQFQAELPTSFRSCPGKCSRRYHVEVSNPKRGLQSYQELCGFPLLMRRPVRHQTCTRFRGPPCNETCIGSRFRDELQAQTTVHCARDARIMPPLVFGMMCNSRVSRRTADSIGCMTSSDVTFDPNE